MRIAKYISNAGFCSRRDAEKLIIKREVYINNILCKHPSETVNKEDQIKIKDKIIKQPEKIRLWKMYKPIKIICTNKDPKKRKTIFDIIPKNYPRLISIGRLDFMSEGILLFTNNGDFARKYELPLSNIMRVYRIYINGKVKKKDIDEINTGITINNISYKKVNAKIEKIDKTYSWIIFKLWEGKNREIRNICNFFSWKIVKLIRIQYGPYKLTKQKSGEITEIKNFDNT